MAEILAQGVIPIIIFVVILWSAVSGDKVYEHFTRGALKGLKITAELLPTLIGLLAAVGVLRASGVIDALCSLAGGLTDKVGFPAQVVPVAFVKIFSSSAATGLMLDIFKNYGADSYEGLLAALILSSTETLMYTISIYYMSVKVTKTRWTVAGAFISMAAGIAGSIFVLQFVTKM
ncbi:putative uncharacterized protein [Firmicutes bacterium CAG:882]|jgi:spore maturation protein B|nr:putative uncharacterized protein [Firmicutes bacterium CAG:882]